MRRIPVVVGVGVYYSTDITGKRAAGFALPVCFGYISHSHQLTLSHYVSVFEIETGSLRTLGLANDRSQRLR
jgi:hypothetical protein